METYDEGNESYHFQVNLGGMLDILSNHLYKSPDVFLRELLQNGADAITMRKKSQPDWNDGRITIFVEPGRRMEIRDNGAGLTEEGIHRFLSVIGQSSKTELIDGKIPEDYIGRFGIGLLSCFMVSDSIIVYTSPLDGGKAHVWTGMSDGTYTLKPLYRTVYHSGELYEPEQESVDGTLGVSSTGTAVVLTAKPGMERYFQPEKIAGLVKYYGLVLPIPVYLSDDKKPLNNIPGDFLYEGRGRLLSFGEWIFDEEFLDAIPIETQHLSGVAYVLSYRTDSRIKNGHRIYLKNMLLTEQGDMLLPSWAFFLRCFINTRGLRPTASREDFYEDDELVKARGEFEEAVRKYLVDMALYEPDRIQQVISIHVKALKSMAVWDDELFRLFIDYLPFETSEGSISGAAVKRAGEASWVSDVPKFKQLKPVFMSQGKLLICTGYTYDEELIIKFAKMFSLPLSPIGEESMDSVLEQVLPSEKIYMQEMLRVVNNGLKKFDCMAHVRRFLPNDLPVLYSISDEVKFLRQLQNSSEISSGMFSGALSSLFESVEEKPLATLYLNLNSGLIRKLADIHDKELLESISKVLYVQALLAGGHPLKGDELKTMNRELLNLIERITQ